jgi:hypothetical protein
LLRPKRVAGGRSQNVLDNPKQSSFGYMRLICNFNQLTKKGENGKSRFSTEKTAIQPGADLVGHIS